MIKAIKKFCFLFLFIAPFLYSNPFERRIQNHLLLEDFQSAVSEAKSFYEQKPNQETLKTYIIALAYSGNERESAKLWQKLVNKYPEEINNKNLIEKMAWGVLKKGSLSSSFSIRSYALLGAAFLQDQRSVSIIKKGLNDSNALIRLISLQLASNYFDSPLKQEVFKRALKEKNSEVKAEAVSALGKVKLFESKDFLENLLSKDSEPNEVKLAAIDAYISLTDNITPLQLAHLTNHPKASCRKLACKMIAYHQPERLQKYLDQLIDDPVAEVRRESLQTVAIIKNNPLYHDHYKRIAKQKLLDKNSEVAITAAWLCSLYQIKEGEKKLLQFLLSDQKDLALLSAATFSNTGNYANDILNKGYDLTKNPYVKFNLALALLKKGLKEKEALQTVFSFLNNNQDMWIKKHWGLFEAIAPNTYSPSPMVLLDPQETNLQIRLEIFSLLLIKNSPQAAEALKKLLKENRYSISALTSSLLLTEADNDAFQTIKNLLKDRCKKISLQVALVLSLLSEDQDAIDYLKKIYPESSHHTKAKILEALGYTNDQSIPFLIEALKERSMQLRIIAAFSLNKILYQ